MGKVEEKKRRRQLEAKLKGLAGRFGGEDQPTATVVFDVDDQGRLLAYVSMSMRQPPLALESATAEEATDEMIIGLVATARALFYRQVAGWLEAMSKLCPVCGGEVEESAVLLAGQKKPAPKCSKCSWRMEEPKEVRVPRPPEDPRVN